MFFNQDCPLRMDKEAVNRAQLKTHRRPTMNLSEPNDTMCVRKNDQICCTRWQCPPNFAMNSEWGVVAAEESQELKKQNYREARVLEEIYPCPSAIPLNPSVATDAYDGHLDDALVPTIPLVSIEDDEEEKVEEKEEAYIATPSEASMAAPPEAPMDLQALDRPQATLEPEHRETPLNNLPISLELPVNVKPDFTTKPGVEADAGAAAAAAYTAILKCKEQGSLIDSDLLISILSNPDLIKKLIVDHGFSEDVLKDLTSPTLDRGSKKSCDAGEPSSSCSGPLSRPKMVIGTNEPSLTTDRVGVVAPFSWTPSAPFTRSRSDEMMVNDLINKLSGSTDNEVKPVVQSTSSLNLKPNVLECRRLISQFGYDKQGEPVIVSEPKTTGPSLRPDIPKSRTQIPNSSLHVAPTTVTSGTGPLQKPHFPNPSFKLVPVQNACLNGPLMAMPAGKGPSPRPSIPKSSFPCVPLKNVCPNSPSVAVTTRECTSARPNNTIFPSVPHNVPQGAPSMVAGIGPCFPNSSLQMRPVQNTCSNGPFMAMTAATGQSPRHDIPKFSFPFVPSQSVRQNAPVAMTAQTGTSPRPNISSLHSVPHNVPQGPLSMAINGPSTKNMEYFKSLIRNHGNEQEDPKVGHVEVVGKSQSHQGPLTYIGQQPMFEKPLCKYFSMPRGCRNGPNCQFKHVADNLPNAGRLFQEAPDSKRVKFYGEFGTEK